VVIALLKYSVLRVLPGYEDALLAVFLFLWLEYREVLPCTVSSDNVAVFGWAEESVIKVETEGGTGSNRTEVKYPDRC